MYLIYFPEVEYEKYPNKHKEYINFGEVNGENEGYKCSIRDRWYRIPSVWVPDAFFLRRNNLYPKFVVNCCNAVSRIQCIELNLMKVLSQKEFYYLIIIVYFLLSWNCMAEAMVEVY